jgi:hypothetical protein
MFEDVRRREAHEEQTRRQWNQRSRVRKNLSVIERRDSMPVEGHCQEICSDDMD